MGMSVGVGKQVSSTIVSGAVRSKAVILSEGHQLPSHCRGGIIISGPHRAGNNEAAQEHQISRSKKHPASLATGESHNVDIKPNRNIISKLSHTNQFPSSSCTQTRTLENSNHSKTPSSSPLLFESSFSSAISSSPSPSSSTSTSSPTQPSNSSRPL